MKNLIYLKISKPTLPPNTKHLLTEFELSTFRDFRTIEDRIVKKDTEDLYSCNFIIETNKELFARVRLVLNIGTTEFYNVDIVTGNIKTPIVGYILSNNEYILYTSPYETSLVGNSHQSTDWIILDEDGLEIWSSLNNNINLQNISVPSSVLLSQRTYYLKARHNGTKTMSIFGISKVTLN